MSNVIEVNLNFKDRDTRSLINMVWFYAFETAHHKSSGRQAPRYLSRETMILRRELERRALIGDVMANDFLLMNPEKKNDSHHSERF